MVLHSLFSVKWELCPLYLDWHIVYSWELLTLITLFSLILLRGSLWWPRVLLFRHIFSISPSIFLFIHTNEKTNQIYIERKWSDPPVLSPDFLAIFFMSKKKKNNLCGYFHTDRIKPYLFIPKYLHVNYVSHISDWKHDLFLSYLLKKRRFRIFI